MINGTTFVSFLKSTEVKKMSNNSDSVALEPRRVALQAQEGSIKLQQVKLITTTLQSRCTLLMLVLQVTI
jgi:hypothetical protein